MNSRLKKWVIGVFLVFGIFFITLKIIVAVWLHPMVESILNEAVSMYTDGLYEVRYDKVRIRPLQRKIEISNFRLTYDSSRVAGDTALQKQLFVNASAREIVLAIGQLQELFFHRFLNVKHVSLASPHIVLYNYTSTFDRSGGRFDAYQLVEQYFDSVHLDYVNISEASFKINNISGKPFQDFLVEHINASIVNLVIDSGTVHRNSGYPKADQFTLMVNNSRYMLPDSLHDVAVGRALFDPIKETIQLSQVAFLPKAEKHEFARALGYQAAWIKGQIGLISMHGIDMSRLIVENTLSVDRLSVDSAGIYVYRDRGVKRRNRKVKERPLVAQSLKNITLPFRFDTITMAHAKVVYEEQAPLATGRHRRATPSAGRGSPPGHPAASGEVSFEDIFASVYHVTNIPSLSDTDMEADLEAMFMGESKMLVHINFPLNRSDNLHHISGQLEEFPLQEINRMIEPTAFASIQSGVGHHLSFEMDVDNDKAIGTMTFEYSDLKVALLNKKDPEENPKLKHKIGSVLANWFVVKTDNISEKEPVREGVIAYKRHPGSSIFSYWSHALISGLKMSVGLEKEPAFPVTPEDEDSKKKVAKTGLIEKLFGKNKE